MQKLPAGCKPYNAKPGRVQDVGGAGARPLYMQIQLHPGGGGGAHTATEICTNAELWMKFDIHEDVICCRYHRQPQGAYRSCRAAFVGGPAFAGSPPTGPPGQQATCLLCRPGRAVAGCARAVEQPRVALRTGRGVAGVRALLEITSNGSTGMCWLRLCLKLNLCTDYSTPERER